MLTFKYFKLEIRDRIAIFTMNRPECKNAMNTEAWIELRSFINYAQTEKSIRVIIIASAVPGVFIAGADIKEFMNMQVTEGLFAGCCDTMNAIERCRKPIIAAVNGAAFGGGFEIALASDIRIAADNAKFGLPEVGLGVIPANGGTHRLAKVIGLGRAKEVILGGRVLKADEAVPIGLAMKCVPEAELMNEALKVAEHMLHFSPYALAIAKQCVNISYTTTFETSQFVENLGFSAMMGTSEMKEGTTAFIEKRKPNF